MSEKLTYSICSSIGEWEVEAKPPKPPIRRDPATCKHDGRILMCNPPKCAQCGATLEAIPQWRAVP